MSQRLALKDDLLKRAEIQLKELPKLEQEIHVLRKRAELTPSVCVIRDELENVKVVYDIGYCFKFYFTGKF